MKNSPRWLLPSFVDIGFCGEGWRRHQAAAPFSVPSIWVIYLVPSKQNDLVDFLMHMWKALGHTQKQHSCTHLLGHAQKTEERGKRTIQMTIPPKLWLHKQFFQNSIFLWLFPLNGYSTILEIYFLFLLGSLL